MKRILSIDLGGRAVLEDGRQVQLVVTDNGLIGAVLATPQGEVARVAQARSNPPPNLEGLDQIS